METPQGTVPSDTTPPEANETTLAEIEARVVDEASLVSPKKQRRNADSGYSFPNYFTSQPKPKSRVVLVVVLIFVLLLIGAAALAYFLLY